MPYSLLEQRWLPVLRASGPAWIRPAQLTESLTDDPVLAIDWPRADFRLASLEFLIGLLATACPPDAGRDWERRWRHPPSPDELEAAFAPLAHAFNLDGPGPRFMQDFEDIQADGNDIAGLLIEAPGRQTAINNADLLVKRGQVKQLSRAAAGMALFTLQTDAPAGGAGNRTGLRGGGPLTTLAIPPYSRPLPLWHLLWANVPPGERPDPADLPHILPWLAPTRVSDSGQIITQEGEHRLLPFWATPRRIRLDFTEAPHQYCDLTGASDTIFATSWRQRPYGANYQYFEHPLSPHYCPKPKDQVWLPVHPQPGGVGYRHFLGLLTGTEGEKPAASIGTFEDRFRRVRTPDQPVWRILAAGFDMDNMKARSFIEAELPVYEPADPERAAICRDQVKMLVQGAKEVADLLRRAVRMALFSEGAKPTLDAALFTSLRARFWADTESVFFDAVRQASIRDDHQAVRRDFLSAVGSITRVLFNEAAPILGADHPERIANAARMLGLSLSGYGKSGNALFNTLGLPPVETKPKAAKPGKEKAA
jgi:CRISPR system Cascade subunit CasA